MPGLLRFTILNTQRKKTIQILWLKCKEVQKSLSDAIRCYPLSFLSVTGFTGGFSVLYFILKVKLPVFQLYYFESDKQDFFFKKKKKTISYGLSILYNVLLWKHTWPLTAAFTCRLDKSDLQKLNWVCWEPTLVIQKSQLYNIFSKNDEINGYFPACQIIPTCQKCTKSQNFSWASLCGVLVSKKSIFTNCRISDGESYFHKTLSHSLSPTFSAVWL